jgi:hypothetical protein
LFVHEGESTANLIRREGGTEVPRQGAVVWVKNIDISAPEAWGDRAEKPRVEGSEDASFFAMRGVGNAIDNERRDCIAAKTVGSGGMEKLHVLVSLQGKLNLCPHSPVDKMFLNRKMEGVHNQRTEAKFCTREGPGLFKQVKKGDEETAVVIPLDVMRSRARPLFTVGSAGPEMGNKLGGRVTAGGGGPGMMDGGTEPSTKGPRWLITEEGAPRDGGRDGSEKRHMIQSISSNRGKSGGGEFQIPGMVDEDPIKANERGNFFAIRPGIHPVTQGKLN